MCFPRLALSNIPAKLRKLFPKSDLHILNVAKVLEPPSEVQIWISQSFTENEKAAEKRRLYKTVTAEFYLMALCQIRLKLADFDKLKADSESFRQLPELKKLAVHVNLSRWDYVNHVKNNNLEPKRVIGEELCVHDYQKMFDDLSVSYFKFLNIFKNNLYTN